LPLSYEVYTHNGFYDDETPLSLKGLTRQREVIE
jgi:hypothetical protein